MWHTVPTMLVALHGFTETDESWSEVLTPAHIRNYCPLLPGHGWLPCPEQTSVASAAAQLANAVPADDGDLLGYSLGGRVALQVALDHPERIKRLILVSSQPGIADEAERQARRARDERLAEILEDDGIGTFVAWWERQPVLKPGRKLRRGAEEAVRSRRLNQDPVGLAASLRCMGQGIMEPLWDRLGELQMPVLLLAGGRDESYASAMQRMAEAMPNAQLVIDPTSGHTLHRENPGFVTDHIKRFLAEA